MFEFGHTLGCILSITCKNKAPKSPQLQACKKVNKNFELKTRQRERKKERREKARPTPLAATRP